MKNILIIILSLLSCNILARGGDQVGNGGDVLVCGDYHENLMMLDMYEARVESAKVDLGADDLNYKEKVKFVLTRLQSISPTRGKLYASWFENFEREVKFLSGVDLEDIDDTGLATIPNNCDLKQIAIQFSDAEMKDGIRYLVNLDLFEKMDENNKAVMVLHELIWREGILANQQNSMKVRKFNIEILKDSPDAFVFAVLSTNLNPKILEYKNYIFRGIESFNIMKVGEKVDVRITANYFDITYDDEEQFCREFSEKEMRWSGYDLTSTKASTFGDKTICYRMKLNGFTFKNDSGFTVSSYYYYLQMNPNSETQILENNLRVLGNGTFLGSRIYYADNKFQFSEASIYDRNGQEIVGGGSFTFDMKFQKVDTSEDFSKLKKKECFIFKDQNVCTNTKRIEGNHISLGNTNKDGEINFELPFVNYQIIKVNLKNYSTADFYFSGNEVMQLFTDGQLNNSDVKILTPAGNEILWRLQGVNAKGCYKAKPLITKPVVFSQTRRFLKIEKTYIYPDSTYVLIVKNNKIIIDFDFPDNGACQ